MINIILGLLVAYSIWMNPMGDGAQMAYIGAAMNLTALVSNGFQMPVFAPGLTEKKIQERDPFHIHKLGNENSKFKILCDWLNFGYAVFSPGDLLMLFGAFYNITGFQLVKNGQNITLKYEYRF
ncbi:DUF5317 family protein [Mesoaciditoga lauensis]|uniref:DUF5317 family protein n=1 Tax=Mesoaciditoga lauensis TaxID=1495039 RepID=UPI0005660827|nr:DUF5317 family protein [Mesoaciditoga lauensis]